MTLSAVPDSHQLSQPAATVGIHAWQLDGSRATSLRVRHASELMVSSGRVWATLDGPHGGPVSGNGDLILMAGARLGRRGDAFDDQPVGEVERARLGLQLFDLAISAVASGGSGRATSPARAWRWRQGSGW